VFANQQTLRRQNILAKRRSRCIIHAVSSIRQHALIVLATLVVTPQNRGKLGRQRYLLPVEGAASGDAPTLS
jgi:hypothetical protein